MSVILNALGNTKELGQARSGSTLQGTRDQNAVIGQSFREALDILMGQGSGQSELRLKSLSNEGSQLMGAPSYQGQNSEESEELYNPENSVNPRIAAFSALNKTVSNQAEWQKVFSPQVQKDDYNILGAIGDGLMTAAKIAGAVMTFL